MSAPLSTDPRRVAIAVAALTASLLLGACSDDAGETATTTTTESAPTTEASEPAEDATTDEREPDVGGLNYESCEDLDLTELNAVTGVEFVYLDGDNTVAEGFGSAECLFGLEEGSTNYVYVDWQVRLGDFADGNYGAVIQDATAGSSTSAPYGLGEWDDATVITEADGDGIQVVALDAPAVYSVRVALADEIADPDAVAAAIQQVLEGLSSTVFG